MLHGGISGSFPSFSTSASGVFKSSRSPLAPFPPSPLSGVYRSSKAPIAPFPPSPLSGLASKLSSLVDSDKSLISKPSSLPDFASKLPSLVDSAKSLISKPSSGGGFAPSDAPVVSPQLDYYKAALAGHYGMDASTAYQEALANTSYQRSVQDLMDAGLNPASLFAAGRVSGANGVSYATQLGSGFVGSGSSGGGSARSKQLFSKEFYNAMQVVGGGIAVAVSKNPFTYPVGATAAKGIMQVVNGFFR